MVGDGTSGNPIVNLNFPRDFVPKDPLHVFMLAENHLTICPQFTLDLSVHLSQVP